MEKVHLNLNFNLKPFVKQRIKSQDSNKINENYREFYQKSLFEELEQAGVNSRKNNLKRRIRKYDTKAEEIYQFVGFVKEILQY